MGSGSTGARSTRSARSASRWPIFRGPTARPSSPEARRRPGGSHPRHQVRRAEDRGPGGRDLPPLHAALQLSLLLGGRSTALRIALAARHRSRSPGRARGGGDPPLQGRVPLHDPRRLRHPGVQRLLLDGHRLRSLLGAPGCRGAAQAARGGHRHGAGQGGRSLRDPHRHHGHRGPLRRHGLQGRGDGEGDHRAPDGHQDRRGVHRHHADGAPERARGAG